MTATYHSTCIGCQTTFIAKTANQQYCSFDCRDKHHPFPVCCVCGGSIKGKPHRRNETQVTHWNCRMLPTAKNNGDLK